MYSKIQQWASIMKMKMRWSVSVSCGQPNIILDWAAPIKHRVHPLIYMKLLHDRHKSER